MARRFKSQARLSSLPTSWAVQPCSFSLRAAAPAFPPGRSQHTPGQDPCRGSRAGRAALHPQLVLQEQGLDAAVLGLQFLFQVVDQCTVGGQTAQTQRAAPGQHLAAVFSAVGTPGLPMRISWISVPAISFSALHKVPAVCPDGARSWTTKLEFSPWKPEK